MFLCFFFFQAEDGIRDDLVTGVQTCALPIFCKTHSSTLGSSPHLPVSVSGTVAERTRYEAFLGSMIRTSWLASRLVSPSPLGVDDPPDFPGRSSYGLRPAQPFAGWSFTSASPLRVLVVPPAVQEY